jgi:hypothetical protein
VSEFSYLLQTDDQDDAKQANQTSGQNKKIKQVSYNQQDAMVSPKTNDIKQLWSKQIQPKLLPILRRPVVLEYDPTTSFLFLLL